MPNFILIYHAGGKQPETPEEGKALMAEWKAWVASLGDAVVNPGTPLGPSKTVSAEGVTNGGGANPVMGFSVVSADDGEAAERIAQRCPHLKIGTIELAEMKSMP